MEVPILKQGGILIATVQAAVTDTDLLQLRRALVEKVVKARARGVIIDLTAMMLRLQAALLSSLRLQLQERQ